MKNMYIDFETIAASLFTIIGALIAYFMTKTLSRKVNDNSKELKSKKAEAYELLIKGFEQQTLNKKSAFSIFRNVVTNNDFDISYVDFLESFIIHVRKNDEDGKLTKGIEAIINPIIEKEREEKPYTNVEENERRLLLAIEDSAKTEAAGVPVSLKNNLVDLSLIIEKKQKSLNKAEKKLKWSTPTTIASLILTIISVALVFIHRPSISVESIKSISAEITKQVDSVTNQTIKENMVYKIGGNEADIEEIRDKKKE